MIYVRVMFFHKPILIKRLFIHREKIILKELKILKKKVPNIRYYNDIHNMRKVLGQQFL